MFRGRPLRFVMPLKRDAKRIKINENLILLPDSKAKAFLQSDGEIYLVPERLCDLGCETPRIYYEKYLGLLF